MSVLASVTSHRELVENLVLRDVRSRYKQSLLGYAWAILNPFILALVFSAVMTFLGQQAQGIPTTLHSYYGVLFWSLFATGLATATEGLVSHMSLITKVYFPREVFPVSAVLSKLVDFGFGLAGLVALLVYYRIVPSAGILLAIPIIVAQLFLTMGLGMLCACANLFYRDVRYLVQLALGILVYFVPNMYTLTQVQHNSKSLFFTLYMLNPMATFIEVSRRLAFPQTGAVEELLPYLAWAVCFSVAIFFIGFKVFKAYEPRFAEFV